MMVAKAGCLPVWVANITALCDVRKIPSLPSKRVKTVWDVVLSSPLKTSSRRIVGVREYTALASVL